MGKQKKIAKTRAKSSSKDKSRLGFLDITYDVRVIIYRMIIFAEPCHNEIVGPVGRTGCRPGIKTHPLFLVCKTLYRESQPIFFKHTTLVIPHPVEAQMDLLSRFHIQHIRNLILWKDLTLTNSPNCEYRDPLKLSEMFNQWGNRVADICSLLPNLEEVLVRFSISVYRSTHHNDPWDWNAVAAGLVSALEPFADNLENEITVQFQGFNADEMARLFSEKCSLQEEGSMLQRLGQEALSQRMLGIPSSADWRKTFPRTTAVIRQGNSWYQREGVRPWGVQDQSAQKTGII